MLKELDKLPISVVMSVFREPENYLRESIESILNQTFKNFEFLIAIDNPNNEKAIEVIGEYAKVDDRVRFFINEENLGPAISRNNLIKKSKGKYIAIMDGDDICLPSRLKEQIEFMEYDKETAILGTLAYKMDADGLVYGILNTPIKEKYIAIYLKNGFMPVIHPSIMVRRDVYMHLGFYKNIREAQDYDFLLRAYYAGFKIRNLNKLLLKYRIHSHKHKISSNKSWRQYINVKQALKTYTKNSNINSAINCDNEKTNDNNNFNNFIANVFEKIFNFSRTHFVLAMDYKNKGNIPLFTIHFLLSFVSPHHAEYIYRLIKTKVMCKINKT